MKDKMRMPNGPLSAAEIKALIEYVAQKSKDKVCFPDRVKAAKEYLRKIKSV